jgi:FlaA1/EpsC-like NDP-sugar epimerase
MGEPVKILHLAEQLIRLSGLTPYEDIDIEFTGLRPGEKLFEELLLSGEGITQTAHEKIRVARAAFCNSKRLAALIEELYQAERALDLTRVRSLLRKIVPEYLPPDLKDPNYQNFLVEADRRQQGSSSVVVLGDRSRRSEPPPNKKVG